MVLIGRSSQMSYLSNQTDFHCLSVNLLCSAIAAVSVIMSVIHMLQPARTVSSKISFSAERLTLISKKRFTVCRQGMCQAGSHRG